MAIDSKLSGLAGGAATAQVASWLDLQGLRSLPGRTAAGPGAGPGGGEEQRLRAVAQQFESVFLGMMLQSMRDAKLADSPFDGEETRFYQGIFDKEISMRLAQGRGLGIADLLVRQLGDRGAGGVAVPAPVLTVAAAAAVPVAAAPDAGASASFAAARGGGPDLPPAAGAFDAANFAAAVLPGHRELDGAAAEVPPPAGPFASSPADFVRKVLPHARTAGAALGVDPLGIVAQAALETGWGRSVPVAADGSGYNLFGIKAGSGWRGSRAVRETLEFEAGVMNRRAEPFRAYDSLASGFADYVRLLGTSARYADAVATGRDPRAFARALQDAGYATDPDYARKIDAILRGDTLREALAALKDPAAGPM